MSDSPQRSALYDSTFFDELATDELLESARVVASVVTDLFKPESVVDIGCGLGAWLRAFQEEGAQTLRGLDGDYVDRSRLRIDPSQIHPG